MSELQRRRAREANTKHGMFGTPVYRVWANMINRCSSPNDKSFYLYGDRGIRVCKRWKTASNFLKDMGKRPSPKHSLDRIDNSKGYSPSNCRWATVLEQLYNRRNTVRFNGETIASISNRTGIKRTTLRRALREKRLNLSYIEQMISKGIK